MPAYMVELSQACPTCDSSTAVEVRLGNNELVGRFCRPCGRRLVAKLNGEVRDGR